MRCNNDAVSSLPCCPAGTSVASPVVAGGVCLLASTLPPDRRGLLNPASMKQALVEGAARLGGMHMFEQGSGLLNLPESAKILQSYAPRASVIPAELDLTQEPYAWPFVRQPIYASAMPLVFNATIVNGMGVTGKIEGGVQYVGDNGLGRLLQLTFEHSDVLWPWSGACQQPHWLALAWHLRSPLRASQQVEAISGSALPIMKCLGWALVLNSLASPS